jgi:hypothetical protein
LTDQEIDQAVAAFDASTGSEHTDRDVLRKFLEADDGKEFVMANLVRLYDGDIAHPDRDEMTSPAAVLREYLQPFMKAMLRRAGHPVYQARMAGGYIDSRNVDANPEFGIAAMVRYRSRRDAAELFADSRFADMHVYKIAAIERTASFPTQIMLSTFLQPKYWVPGGLLLLASLAQNLVLLLRGTGT